MLKHLEFAIKNQISSGVCCQYLFQTLQVLVQVMRQEVFKFLDSFLWQQ